MPKTPADAAAAAPVTPFQEFLREHDPAMEMRIPLPGPVDPILRDLARAVRETPQSERGHACHDGTWSSICLAVGSGWGASRPAPRLASMPAVSALLDRFGGCAGFCTLARIAPGDLLDWHVDPLSADGGIARLHLPVVTNPGAVTDLCHRRVHWPVGTLHYGDYGFPHRVFNTGATERIHLYFDVSSEAIAQLLDPELCQPRHDLRARSTGLMHRYRGRDTRISSPP
ncbi:MAG: aspartyl/asparaginyl beta-hydroxylase domain-containing protein [Thalassobaculaceae bacterium]